MWYWLDGLVNSRLIEAGLLAAVRVAGFLLGVMLAAALLRRASGRYGWILMVFLGALCTKGLITLFEKLEFYTWELMQASPYFIPFGITFLLGAGALGACLIYKSRRRRRRY